MDATASTSSRRHSNGARSARAAGVDMKLVHGDVTDLVASGVGDNYRLVLDTGTFHGFDTDDQHAMGRGVDAITAPDAPCCSSAGRGGTGP
jgi:hypothetical protein